MTEKVNNTRGTIFYGMHFCPGVAQYSEPKKDPYRIFLNQDTINKMNQTFTGRPVFVQHVDDIDDRKEDGFVVESFYNAVDGKTWAKFLITTDIGLKAISDGWKLSNAYQPKDFAAGGLWNGVSYEREVTEAEYEHLAIVPNPRYDESIILTPEQFKKYNETKKIELTRVANSQGEKSVFTIFKKEKIENALDMEKMSIVLPKSKIEISLKDLVGEMDTIKNMHGYASGEHMVKSGDDEMSVNEMIDCYGKMKSSLEKIEEEKKKNAEEMKVDVEKNANDREAGGDNGKSKEDLAKEQQEAIEKKKNAEAEDLKKEQERKTNALFLKEQQDAHLKIKNHGEGQGVIRVDNLARGRELFG